MNISRTDANTLAHAMNGNTAARTPEQILNERRCLTIKEHLCKGRTLNLLQFSRTSLLNLDFCHQRANHWHLRHGRMGNHISATLKAEFFARMQQLHSTQRRFRWYCRHKLWGFAEQRGKDNTDELSSEEFLEALAFIDDYYRHHLSQRLAFQVEQYTGPQSQDDRADATKLHYLGIAHIHKLYDASIFNEELECIREGLSFESALEREFEMALAQTSHLHFAIMGRTLHCRSLSRTAKHCA